MNSGVYIITNKESGRIYIGSTVNFEERWRNHRYYLQHNCHHNSHLQRSWNKYGEDTFEFGVLEYLDNLEELTKAEQFWMDIYCEEGKELYNFSLAADNPFRGCKHTEEARRKISEAMKGRSTRWGTKHSEETRQKMSRSAKGRTVSEETRRRMSESAKTRPPVSDETRRKMSASQKRRIKNGT